MEEMQEETREKEKAFCEASEQALVAIRNILLRVAHAHKAEPSCPAWALREMLAIADTAHNLPRLAVEPEKFSPEMLATCAKSYRQRYAAGSGSVLGFSYRFWEEVDKLIGPDLSGWTRADEGEFQ